ncbi:hypothetical protein [Thaumasiovibrio sp. DFM-14]|uniref:hypothetical protein n=1 Tax=Thaumasiovibrio sp. DFM-14 TaxID=3384792 RepID=UPI0039A3037C
MQLTHAIARQIVAREMKIIHFSVNAMGENGQQMLMIAEMRIEQAALMAQVQ